MYVVLEKLEIWDNTLVKNESLDQQYQATVEEV